MPFTDSRAAQSLRRKLKEVTQVELSKRTGISQSQLSRLANCERSLSDRQDGIALRREAGIELEWWDEPPLPESEPPPAPTRTESSQELKAVDAPPSTGTGDT